MKVIVFGANGQDGHYLEKIFASEGVEMIGISRGNNKWVKGNVADLDFVSALIKNEKPDYVFHLAANSTIRHDSLFENHETISTGTLNVLESVYRHHPSAKIFISGSALQFENKGLPISETTPFEARDPYSVARIQSVYAARYYRRLGLKVYVGYFFNHDSPLRSERHVNQKIVQAVKRIAAGSKEILEVGNVDTKKEFTYAGDTAEAIWLLVNNENVFETVIGSGLAYSIAGWTDICFNFFGLNWKDHVTTKDDFRPDYDILVSDPSTLKKLGWKQKTDIEKLAELMIEYKAEDIHAG